MEKMKEYGPHISGALGTLLSARGEYASGANANRAMKYRARQLEQNAGQAQAEASVAAQEESRKSELIASRAMAVVAASGGGTLDPTVVRILQGIDAEGSLATATQLYNGDERARGMRDQAKADRYEGRLHRSAGRKKALSTILSGVDKFATTWGSANDRPSDVFKKDNVNYDGRTTA
jgi:hypothetical protein